MVRDPRRDEARPQGEVHSGSARLGRSVAASRLHASLVVTRKLRLPVFSGGRGFIALAAMIFGRWTPIGSFGGALLFGAITALGIVVNVRPPDGDLGTLLTSIPTFWYAALPYLVTIVILAGVVGRSRPPAADGIPYLKEGQA